MRRHLLLPALALIGVCSCKKIHNPGSGSEVNAFTGWTEQSYVLVGEDLYANGSNLYGQLGLGNTTNVTTFTLTMTGVTTVSSNLFYTLVLKKDGSVWAAGLDTAGQFGDGTTDNATSWRQVMTGVKAISSGMGESLFIKTDNSLWGGGSDLPWAGFTPHKLMDDVLSVSAGTGAAMIVKTDNTLWSVGANIDRQLGDGTLDDHPVPVQVMSGVLSASMSTYHALILKTDHTLWAVGDNGAGQLGTGDENTAVNPVQVLTDVVAFSSGPTNAIAIRSDSTVWMTGDNFAGELGDGFGGPTGKEQRIDAFKQVLTGAKSVSMTDQFVMVVKRDNTVWVAGDNAYGQLGFPTASDPEILAFTQMPMHF